MTDVKQPAVTPDRGGLRFPDPVTAFIAILASLAGGVAMAGASSEWTASVAWTALPIFVVTLAIAGSLQVRFQYRDQVMALDLFEAELAPAIFLFPAPILVPLVGISKTISEVFRRNAPRKAAFNISQWMLAAGLGRLTVDALGGGASLTASAAAGVVAAMAVVAVVNLVAFSVVVRLAQGQPVHAVIARVGPTLLLGWGINTAFGLLFLTTVAWHPAAAALSLVALAALHWAYRGHAAALADRTRMEGLHRAARALSGPIDPREAIPLYLAEVLACFGSEVVELVLLESGGRTVHRFAGVDATGYARTIETEDVRSLAGALIGRPGVLRVDAGSTDRELVDLLRREGWRDCLAAPLVADGTTLGVLCAYNRSGLEGFEEGEIAVMHALAGEAAAMIHKGILLDEILEERRKVAEIVSLASDGIMTVTADGTIQTWNPGMEETTGYEAAAMLGARHLAELRARNAEGADVLLERWAERDEPLPRDVHIVGRDGEPRWLSCTYTRVAEPDGRPRLLIVVARDVTRLRELEQLKDDFVATVSHELRTPLTPIKGWAQTLLDQGEQLGPEDRKLAAESIHRQAAHLERLITNLLQASRIETGGNVQRDATVDLGAVARKVVEEFRSGHPGRTIRLEQAGRSCPALGDDLWIERILANLLSNAEKYSPREEPIDVRIMRGHHGVEVHVTDRGPGIAHRDAEKVFERFRRLGNPTTRPEGGAGLGLYIARQLAHSIGGTLSVISEPGEGSTFVLRLRPAGRLVAVV